MAKVPSLLDDARAALRSSSESERARGREVVEELATDGNAEATYAVATWYIHGVNGYPTDLTKAEALLTQAARKLFPAAIYDLASLEEMTKKERGRRRKAFGLYLVAALAGDEDSKGEVLRCLYWGTGTYKNPLAAELLSQLLDSSAGAQS